MIGSTLGFGSCGPTAKVSDRATGVPPMPDMTIENVRFSKQGINITGAKGESINIGKDGTAVKDRNGKVWKSKRDLDVGVGGDKKKVPVSMAIWVLYMGLTMWRFSGTIGMKIMKLKVVDFATGGTVPADRLFLRAVTSLLSLFGMLGYAWALWERSRRTWHDILAGTRIVKA